MSLGTPYFNQGTSIISEPVWAKTHRNNVETKTRSPNPATPSSLVNNLSRSLCALLSSSVLAVLQHQVSWGSEILFHIGSTSTLVANLPLSEFVSGNANMVHNSVYRQFATNGSLSSGGEWYRDNNILLVCRKSLHGAEMENETFAMDMLGRGGGIGDGHYGHQGYNEHCCGWAGGHH